MENKNNCIICGNLVEESEITEHECIYKKCPCCGRYIVPFSSVLLFNDTYFGNNKDNYNKEKLIAYLYYNKKSHRCAFIGTQSAFDNYKKANQLSEAFLVTSQMVEDWYPKNITDKIDLILLEMGRKAKYLGDTLLIHRIEDDSLLFITHNDIDEEDKDICAEIQAKFILDAMSELGYIKYKVSQTSAFNIAYAFEVTILVKGYARIYELQKNHSTNKDVFVAMSFHESANDIREAIKQGIDNAEYSSILMDEIVHNHQIVPEMLRLIKESRFMIMDITQPNFGAYYEAGYAQGLGKEVIVTCSQEVWDKKDFSCDKDKNCVYKQISTKPHFDIAQKQVLKWKDYADLTKQLTEWIKLIID